MSEFHPARYDPSVDPPEPQADDSDLEDLEVAEGWIIRSHADGRGFRATRVRSMGDYRALSVRLDSGVIEFEGDECSSERFPIPVMRRLFDLLDSEIARRDQERSALYEVERG